MDQNQFINHLKQINQLVAQTWNGAISNATTGSKCLDYFSKAGTYRGRSAEEINKDMFEMFAEDPQTALKLVFAVRLITRKPGGMEEVQTGYGNRNEFYKAIQWMALNRSLMLYANLTLIPIFGCWKDFFNEPLLDSLERMKVYEVCAQFRAEPNLLKYLPQIRSSKKARSERDKKRIAWAKGFCKFMGITEKQYRKHKALGQSHEFQRLMSKNEWSKIDLNTIPGKAMLHLTSRKGKDGMLAFQRHGQITRLTEWVMSKDKINFTGYPYELTRAASLHKNINILQKTIFNKQFNKLVEGFNNHKLGNVLCALDTSGSMSDKVCGEVTALDICISMGLVFSSLNIGAFKDKCAAFDNQSKLIDLSPAPDFVSKLHFIESKYMNAMGSTNFQSVIDLIVQIRQTNPQIPLSDYPETLLVLSDMQFNPVVENPTYRAEKQAWEAAYNNWQQTNPRYQMYNVRNQFGQIIPMFQQVPNYAYAVPPPPSGIVLTPETNYKQMMDKLRAVGLGEMRVIWWHLNARNTTDFPATMNDKGCYLISGFDPVNLKALLKDEVVTKVNEVTREVTTEKVKKTPMEAMRDFLSQPIFSLLRTK